MIADYIVNHQAEFWLVLGFAMLTIEIVTGFTTGVFLFVGLGAISTGLIMNFGLLEESWINGVACTGISSGIITFLLWKPLKNLQNNKPIEKDNSSDLVGHEFVVESDITLNQAGTTNYSGITWKVEIDNNADIESIAVGQRVKVSSVEVGVFKVVVAQ